MKSTFLSALIVSAISMAVPTLARPNNGGMGDGTVVRKSNVICSQPGNSKGTHCAFLSANAVTYGATNSIGNVLCTRTADNGYPSIGKATCQYVDGQYTQFRCLNNDEAYMNVAFGSGESFVSEKGKGINYYWSSEYEKGTVSYGQGTSDYTFQSDDNLIVTCEGDKQP